MMQKKQEKPEFTPKQQKMLDTLKHAQTPLSAYTLLDELRDDGFKAPLQIYRTLEQLIKKGAVHRLESLNAFIACRHTDCSLTDAQAVLFAICNECGSAHEETHLAFDHMLSDFAEEIDFMITSSVIELKGLCAACRST